MKPAKIAATLGLAACLGITFLGGIGVLLTVGETSKDYAGCLLIAASILVVTGALGIRQLSRYLNGSSR